ncbi:hypothetical protein MAIT1_04698 [Magnetofaba australis IT-1]|uniref:DUF6362 domain-containing protein n=2 Tax=Magnetofaba TaxID=1472292 RepID=A0A1Y2KBR6_9PROT|nr:hypothetical protein MAIT1_04698 [Magnetofaba australis IT-1]
MVAERLEEAANTLKQLPDHNPQAVRSAWPDVVHEFYEAYGHDSPRVRLGPPTGEAIDRMDQTLLWLRWLDGGDMQLVWSRACRVPWKLIGQQLGVGRTTAWQRWMAALLQVATRLNAQRSTA